MDYSKYKFNYFDVVKRHERIINRPKDWEIKVLACIMLFVTFCYVFTSGVFAIDEERVDVSVVNNISIASNRNYFNTSSGTNVAYFELEQGYIYHIFNNNTTNPIQLAVSNNIPDLNVQYNYIGILDAQTSYDYIGNGYLFFSYSSNLNGNNAIITREKIANYEGVVSDLVENVGVNQFWNIFDNGISFVGVVVLVAFGLFLVVLAIKKVSKGKSEF